MMDNKTRNMIGNFLREEIEGVNPEDVATILDNGCKDSDVAEIARSHGFSALEAKELASIVRGMKEGTQNVRVAALGGGSQVTETNERKPWVPGRILTGAFVSALAALVVVLLLVQSCTGRGNVAPTVTQTDAKISDLESSVAKLQTEKADKTELAKKADSVALEKLDQKVDRLEKKLDKDIARLDKELADKANKSDLDKYATKRRLRAVEKKLDDHIAEAEEEEEIPAPEPDDVKEQSTPVAPGTYTYILHPVPVDEEE